MKSSDVTSNFRNLVISEKAQEREVNQLLKDPVGYLKEREEKRNFLEGYTTHRLDDFNVTWTNCDEWEDRKRQEKRKTEVQQDHSEKLNAKEIVREESESPNLILEDDQLIDIEKEKTPSPDIGSEQSLSEGQSDDEAQKPQKKSPNSITTVMSPPMPLRIKIGKTSFNYSDIFS